MAFWLAPWFAMGLACAANAAQASALQASSVRLVYVKDHTFYFADGHAKVLYEVDVDVPIGAFSVSPDSTQIAFASGTGDFGGSLRLLTVATGRIELLRRESQRVGAVHGRSDSAYTYDVPEFSPTGKSIAYVVRHGKAAGDANSADEPFEIMDVGTRRTHALKSDAMLHKEQHVIGRLSWSPDEKYLVIDLPFAPYLDLGTQRVQRLAEDKRLSDAGTTFGWYGENCVIVDGHERRNKEPHQPADLLIYGMNSKSLTPLLETIKVPVQDLPAFTQLEVSDSLMLLTENDRRVLLYNFATHKAVATIEAARARLVPTRHAGVSCE
jgi:hypothetical protein